VDVSTGNLRILAIVDNSDNKLKAGKAVKITLVSRAVVPSLYLPTQALIPTTGGYHIYVLSGGKAKYQKIATGMRSGNSLLK
jgi:membrane fusion protein (multidrug efflux system)